MNTFLIGVSTHVLLLRRRAAMAASKKTRRWSGAAAARPASTFWVSFSVKYMSLFQNRRHDPSTVIIGPSSCGRYCSVASSTLLWLTMSNATAAAPIPCRFRWIKPRMASASERVTTTYARSVGLAEFGTQSNARVTFFRRSGAVRSRLRSAKLLLWSTDEGKASGATLLIVTTAPVASWREKSLGRGEKMQRG
eukprot:3477573-Rhodomonas_salina.4